MFFESFSSLIDDILCSAIKWGINYEVNFSFSWFAEIVKKSKSFISIGASQSNNDRYVNLYLRSCIDDALSNCITFHDTSENVNEDSLYLGMLTENLKCCLHLFSICTATDIEEVCRLATLELNNIHCGHGKASSIYHASNVAVKGNVVEASSDCFFFIIILICCRSEVSTLFVHVKQFLLSEKCIIINVDLSINTINVLLGGNSPWVNLNLGSIKLNEHLIKLLKLINSLISEFSRWKLQWIYNLSCALLGKSLSNIKGVNLNSIRVLLCYLFNIHSTLSATHNT